VSDAGLTIVRDEIVPMHEEGFGETRFLWILARR
jgi:hypothetical protein